MGRAIEMENQIDSINMKLSKLENIVRGMAHTLDELEESVSKSKEKKTNGKEKSNNEGNDGSSGKSNKRKTNTVSKTVKC